MSSNQSEHAKSIFRPNITGTAYERHQKYIRDYVDVYGSSSRPSTSVTKRTDFDVLKERHRFLRSEEEASSPTLPWEEKLAAKYEASLYKEFAVCDLKHYKMGGVALRWRTEDEVVARTGETTCGNTRCEHHHPIPSINPGVEPPKLATGNTRCEHHHPIPSINPGVEPPKLATLEVPFAYVERGEQKSALVKLVLCPSCVKKLTYKQRKKEAEEETLSPGGQDEDEGCATPQAEDHRVRNEDHRSATQDRKRREEKTRRSYRDHRDHREWGKGERERERGRDSRRHERRSASPPHK
ncbi:folate-sensitive fragile site protein Fra10Ac1-domain-containing protein [Cantharellus anzutake]|uniref:folate-sensitive fragile site protein Fra10Ac1-domain-containing protein n=1 Tax=Cantharellus anzutake TaxID=1750568 RepID=UPI001903442E|nr:folate-sensitive fragile site protein Fra10Ac1-domain-containing protein [Cantharellus anzutake]KAF8340312.1 folate-sensitive fragile site protein Fra10Ac1-domain-containing protein [Cantharellus anzutake]